MKIIDTASSMIRSVREHSPTSMGRIALCIKCPFKQLMKVPGFNPVITCGTPITGSKIKFKGKIIELCGCVMDQKVRDPLATCPVGKW